MYLHKDFIMIFSRFLAHEQSYLSDTLRVEIQQKSNQKSNSEPISCIFLRFLAEGHPT